MIYLFTVTTKAVAGAKSLGNFLYSAVNKAGAKVSEASAKIKETVEKNVSKKASLQGFAIWDLIRHGRKL